MKNYIKSGFIILYGAVCFISFISFRINGHTDSFVNSQAKFPSDSVKVDSLQLAIAHQSQAIINYYVNINKIKNLTDELANINIAIVELDKNLSDIKTKKVDELLNYKFDISIIGIESCLKLLSPILKDEEKLNTNRNKLSSEKNIKENELEAYKKKKSGLEINYQIAFKKIQEYSLKITGSTSIVFHGVTYNLYVSSLDSEEIRLHLKMLNSNSKYYNIGSVKAMLESQKHIPLMITNGGMYTPSNEPEGLYIEDHRKLYDIDSNKSPKPEPDNFYLMPNGVFYIDNIGKAHIDTTQEFARKYPNEKIKEVKIATQSGPQLVINGRFNSAFNFPGNSKKIRSGVGVINDSTVVFIISKEGTTFYDFAILFKDIFNCNNALFLDGAISLMYLRDIDNQELGGNFGPIISVTKK